jgi:O-antigen ligase
MTSLAYAALWIFIFSIPWERIFALPGISIVSRVTGAVALGLALLAVVISGRFRRLHPFHVAAVLFWLWAAAELLLYHYGERLPYKFWTYGQLILVLWMIWELAPSEPRQRGLLTAFVFGAYVAAFETINVYRRQAGALRRFAAGGADGNDLAMVLALALPMAWYLGMTYRQPLLRWACRLYLPVAVVALGLTGSRGGMLATTVALLIVPLSMTRLSPGRLVTAIVILGTAGILAVAYTPETLIERLSTTRVEVEGGRFGGRGKLWKAGLAVYPENPVFGYGTGGFKSAITPKLGPASQVAHNSYLSVLVEQGAVGFLLYMTMFVAVLHSILKLPLLERRFALVLFATLGIAMFPLTWEDRRAAWYVLAALLGLSQAYVTGQFGAAVRQPPRVAVPPVGRPLPPRPRERLRVPGRDDARDAPA